MTRLAKAVQLFLVVLRELFDESSYARFLSRSKIQSSPEAYAAFWDERESSHSRRPRCC